VSALAGEVARRCPAAAVVLLRADDLKTQADLAEQGDEHDYPRRAVALFIVEDLHRLPLPAAEKLAQRFDECLARQQQMVFTSAVGPRQLRHLPARLTSRLSGGLVVGLELFGPASRLAFLCDRAQRRQLPVPRDVLAWLAENVGGSGRQLEGVVARLEELVRLHDRLPDREAVARHFRAEADAAQPTVERIAEQVCRYFRIDRRQLRSRQRFRSALVPRQIGMYLARQLTELSLEQIGAFFGGRDHSTVLHACRKIDRALASDPSLSGTIRQLRTDLV
jgi:chromosomal replication initiator protein